MSIWVNSIPNIMLKINPKGEFSELKHFSAVIIKKLKAVILLHNGMSHFLEIYSNIMISVYVVSRSYKTMR